MSTPTPVPPAPVPSRPALPAPTGQPDSLRRHRRQTIWQIWVPLGVFILLILAMAVGVVLAAAGASPELGRWSSMSLIMLIIPTMFAAVIVLVIFAGLVFLMAKLLHVLPAYTQMAQAYAHLLSVIVRVNADRLASPAIKARSAWAGWETLRRRLF